MRGMTGLRRTAVVLLAAAGAACATTPKPAAGPPVAPPPIPAPAFPSLVPRPVSMRVIEGAPAFAVTPTTPVYVQSTDPRAVFAAEFLAGLLTTVGPEGPAVIQMGASIPDGSIVLEVGGLDPALGGEAYRLSVTGRAVTLTGASPAGLFHGVQTLRQILPAILEHDAARPRPIAIPQVEIEDHPRFAWRGAMLDVARHFFGVEDVKRYIDLMALHKLNRLHLHLSDDQGFRIEIKSWPNLTAIGGRTEVGGTVGGFYTQEQYADLVAYARDRFIEIVPEIDMPGHTNAALASYPELNCDGVAPPPYTDIKVGFSVLCVGSETTWRFLGDVIREVAALTPGPFLHIGGDEVKKLEGPDYAAFITRVQGLVERNGKRMIGWDEIASADLSKSSIVQHWRPKTDLSAVAAKGIPLIMSPANRAYLDMQYDPGTWLGLFWAGRIEVRDAYDWDPATLMPGVGEASVLGVEAPLWSETLATIREVESMAFPRLAAIAEVAWTPQAGRDWEDFRLRLGGMGPRFQALGLNFYRSPQIPWRP